MAPHPAPPRSPLGWYRQQLAEDPVTHAVSFARALNAWSIDEGRQSFAMDLLEEAGEVLVRAIDVDGATPVRVHHLVMICANQAQLAASPGAYDGDGLARALERSATAVEYQREFLDHATRLGQAVPPGDVARMRATLAEVLLIRARVQAACGLLDEAAAAYREAEQIISSDRLELEWGDALRTVGEELGCDLEEWGGPLPPDERVLRWWWYGR